MTNKILSCQVSCKNLVSIILTSVLFQSAFEAQATTALSLNLTTKITLNTGLRPPKSIKRPEASIPRLRSKIKVRGTVSDNKGLSLPGVSVKLRGGTAGVTTGADGTYSITLNNGNGVLVFSYMGYVPQEVVINGRTEIDVVLKEKPQDLNEVVVTALGIKREKKALVYSVTEVEGDQFTQARENNIANALTGKVAGVNATGLSTGPGGSSRVIIRGNGSLAGNNQPLYVVNGMPIENSVPGGSATSNGLISNPNIPGAPSNLGNVDRGDGIGGINPDDIESISVLKGGTAAALYGARAANGVILITTKKGKAQRGIGIDYNTTYTVETPAIVPNWQYEYGQGTDGTKPLTQAASLASGRRSFGAKIDGSDYIGIDGSTQKYSAQRDNIKNFYDIGSTFTNTLAFNGGNEVFNYRFSGSDMNSKSIQPNSKFNRKTGSLSIGGKLGSKVTLEAMAQYNVEAANNRPTAGDALGNANWSPYMIANTADVRLLNPGYNDLGNELPWNDAGIATNSYFVVNKFKQKDSKNRFIGQAALTYELVKNLSLKGSVARDFYNFDYEYVLPTGTLYVPNGSYNKIEADASETNALLSLTYKGRLSNDFTLNAMAGGNQQRSVYNEQNTKGQNFTIPYFYSSTNLSTIATTPENNRTAINSVFGSADLGFRSYAFLTFTGRQDWFSTLSTNNNSLFYPSVGASFVVSDAVRLPRVIDFMKIRASWAQVGGGAPDPYRINMAYSMQPTSGQPIQNATSTTITNKNLRPYTSTTIEGGFEARLFNNRLGFDLTLYDRKTTNDIVTTPISGTSGYSNVVLNVGALDNRGVELLITGTPVKSRNFSWNASFNAGYNQNKVVELSEGLDQVQLGVTVNNYAYVNNVVGQPYGSIVGTKMVRDANDNVVFNSTTGLPVVSGLQVLGKGVAPLTMGLSNDFRYKDFTLNVLVDGKFGNKIFSVMDVYATRLGLTQMTLPGRDGGLTVTGVDQTGATYSGFIPVSGLQSYYDNYRTYSELFLYDAGFVKLRQVVLTYQVPIKKLRVIKAASVSAVARNLFIIYSQVDNFDPESSFNNGAAQGFESIGLPRTRSLGLNLMVKF